MQIDYQDGLFLSRCSFDERLAFQDAGWFWHPEHRAWATKDPIKADAFEPFFRESAKAARERWVAHQDSALAFSYAESSVADIPVPDGLAYDPHQIAAIVFAKQHPDMLLADPPGLGKTICAIGLSNYLPEIKRILIVPPAHLKVNWEREWRKWDIKGLTVGQAKSIRRIERQIDPETGKSMKGPNGRTVYMTGTDHIWADTDVVICNYDMLPTFETKIRSHMWDLLILDESHYLVTEGSIRTRHTLGGGKQKKKSKVNGIVKVTWNPPVAPIPSVRRLLMTGTPLMSRPIDLWTTVKALDPNGLGRNWKTFTKRYCGGMEVFGRYDVTGATNQEELQIKLRTRFMMRRDKETVMKDLPPKRRQLIELPAEGLAKLVDREISAIRRVRDALSAFEQMLGGKEEPPEIEWKGLAEALERRFGHLADLDYVDRFKNFTAPEKVAFQEWSTARRELAVAKIPMVVEHINSFVSAGEKVIVFVVHTDMADALRDAFPSCAFVTGKTPAGRRQAEVDRFQDDPGCNPIIGNIIAAGTGYTMTASHIVIMAELDPVPALVEQAEDRAWRRGQKNAVLCQHLAVEGSVDARLVEVFLEKQKIIHSALDVASLDLSQNKDLLFRG